MTAPRGVLGDDRRELRPRARRLQELSALPRGIGDVHGAIAGRVFARSARRRRRSGAARRDRARRPTRPCAAGCGWPRRRGTARAARRASGRCRDAARRGGDRRRSTASTATGSRPRAARSRSRCGVRRAVRRAAHGPRLAVFVTASARPSSPGAHRLRRAPAEDSGHAGLRPLQHRPPRLRERRLARRAARRAVADWPVAVERLALIGHSMGGLVARSACHHGGAWTRARAHTSRSARRTRARRWSRPCTR